MTTILHLTYLITVLVSAIFSLKTFRLKWPLTYKLFSAFLITALITELAGTLWAYDLFEFQKWDPFKTGNNNWLITFLLIPQYLFFITIYYSVLKNERLKKVVAAIAILYTIFAILNLAFGQGISIINSYTHIAASFVMLFLVLAYFEQIRKDKVLINLRREPLVWISLGNFIYHLINIPFLFTINYLIKSYPQIVGSFFNFYLIILIITYSLYIKAFLCPQPQK